MQHVVAGWAHADLVDHVWFLYSWLELGVSAGGLATEVRLALLGERRGALVVIGALADALVIDALHATGSRERHVKRVVDVLLGLLDHDVAVGVDSLSQLGGF